MLQVGVLQFSILVRGSRSLKTKRRVVRSIKDRLKARYNVSVAEVDDQDVWQRATLGLATVGNDARKIRSVLDTIVAQLRVHPEAELLEHQIDILD